MRKNLSAESKLWLKVTEKSENKESSSSTDSLYIGCLWLSIDCCAELSSVLPLIFPHVVLLGHDNEVVFPVMPLRHN